MIFGKEKFIWKFYITNKALPITKQIQLINLKKFVIATLDADSKTFIVYVAIKKPEEMDIDLDKKAQIKAQSRVQI